MTDVHGMNENEAVRAAALQAATITLGREALLSRYDDNRSTYSTTSGFRLLVETFERYIHSGRWDA